MMRQLRSLGDINVQTVEARGCPSLDLNCLSEVRGLKHLILHATCVKSLAFIAHLRELQTLELHLVSGASKFDLTPLFSCPTLRNIETNVGERVMRDMAARLPSTIHVGSGALKFVGVFGAP